MTYTVRWTEISDHERTLTNEEMAEIKGITVEELAELDEDQVSEGLSDELAELDDDGFRGLTREIDGCTEH
ncbi:hypothetical protein [Streptomyces sp. NPDC092295]|uniref:hypothetical protein n=1 Tax=Streptomyces sp. NPDC092295 TaxID=3366011 RepID=UPI0037F3D23A